jgi:xanthine dehydrogenase/oxidase
MHSPIWQVARDKAAGTLDNIAKAIAAQQAEHRMPDGIGMQAMDARHTSVIEEARNARSQAAATAHAAKCKICHGMNPAAHALAMNNGTQCGYCSVGFVMSISALLATTPRPTKREIEDHLDGNLCRCTGYRPILTAMQSAFAGDWSEDDERDRMKCEAETSCHQQVVQTGIHISFPEGAKIGPQPSTVCDGDRTWHSPASLDELVHLLPSISDTSFRLVHGNTSYGVYPGEFQGVKHFVDLRHIPDLHGLTIDGEEVVMGAGTSYKDLIEELTSAMASRGSKECSRLSALLYMARRTGGTILRNTATVGGNTMLVLQHLHAQKPFTSDLFTALWAIDPILSMVWARSGTVADEQLSMLMTRIQGDPSLVDDIILLNYRLPVEIEEEITFAQKVALREVNAQAIVNMTTSLQVTEALRVENAILSLGGIGRAPWRAAKTERAMKHQTLSLKHFKDWAPLFEEEIRDALSREPNGDTEDEYRTGVARSFFFKTIVHALHRRAPEQVPDNLRSAGATAWGDYWRLSTGKQTYEPRRNRTPIGRPYVKLNAMYQTSGQIQYTQELPYSTTCLHGAFVLSKRALSGFQFATPDGRHAPATHQALAAYLAEVFDGFVDVLTSEQVEARGGVNLHGIGMDQPLFASNRVLYVGQSVALVIGKSEKEAALIAQHVEDECVDYDVPMDWGEEWDELWREPILSLDDARARQSIYPDNPVSAPWATHIWKVTRPGSDLDWVPGEASTHDVDDLVYVKGVACHQVRSAQRTGSQAHFCMETQACLVECTDDDRIRVHASTQDPKAIHASVAAALALRSNDVEVVAGQVGGGFGAKTEPARFVAVPAAIASYELKETVRVALTREQDSALIGKRHPYYGEVRVAVDSRQIIRGLQAKLWGDGGAFYDCSFIVSDCIQLRTDNAYYIENYETEAEVCRTNTAPNTAFRAFGYIQSNLIIENAIEEAAVALDLCPTAFREKNLYRRQHVTPAGQALPYCYLREVWSHLKTVCDFEDRQAAVAAFNQHHRWRKRGMCMLPLKYGTGFNLPMLEQATAIISVHKEDGSITIHQGGVEMGQGLWTQIEQIAAHVLHLPMDLIRVDKPRTSVIPNPVATGASTGTAYNGEAVRQACEELRERLVEFGHKLRRDRGEAACRDAGIDFWNEPEDGWRAMRTNKHCRERRIWQHLVDMAHWERVNLVSQFHAKIPGGTEPVPFLTYKPRKQQPRLPGVACKTNGPLGGPVHQFVGFTYSAACSEVEVDILTGEAKVIRSDIVYDAGRSLNPALDIGQVEGAFVQGIGYVLSERLHYQTSGDERGRLHTVNTSTYKVPTTTTVPLEMNVHLFPRDMAGDVPENPNNLYSAKEVGEPPLVLAGTVFFALKAAVRASRRERGLNPSFRLDAPATVDEVQRAAAVTTEQMTTAL